LPTQTEDKGRGGEMGRKDKGEEEESRE